MRNPQPATDINKIPELMPVKKGEEREKKGCTTQRGSGLESAFFIDGNTLLILETVFFTIVALILIARDSE